MLPLLVWPRTSNRHNLPHVFSCGPKAQATFESTSVKLNTPEIVRYGINIVIISVFVFFFSRIILSKQDSLFFIINKKITLKSQLHYVN